MAPSEANPPEPPNPHALARIGKPTDRAGEMLVASSQASEAEVDVIEMAIDHPPPKPDHFGTAVSALGAIYTIARAISAPVADRKLNAAVIAAAAILGVAQVTRYVVALLAKTPIKNKAKQHIRRMRIAQGCKVEDEPPSNWRRLRELLWRKVLAFLGDKTP